MQQASLIVFFLCNLSIVVGQTGGDSQDCLTEYTNAVANGNVSAFCKRCASESGSNPIPGRCSLCTSKCPSKSTGAATCSLDSGAAVANIIDTVLYSWAAYNRCDQSRLNSLKYTKVNDKTKKLNEIVCSTDILEALSAASDTATAIVGMVNSCGAIKDQNPRCGITAGYFASATIGLASQVDKIPELCPDWTTNGADPNWEVRGNQWAGKETYLGKCVVNAGTATNRVFRTVNVLNKLKCDGKSEKACASSVLTVTAVLSALGADLSQTISWCSVVNGTSGGNKVSTAAEPNPQPKFGQQAGCSGAILASFARLQALANTALQMSEACKPTEAERLWLERDDEEDEKAVLGSSSAVWLPMAMLPVTVAASFFLGRRYSKSRRPTRDVLVLQEEGEECVVE